MVYDTALTIKKLPSVASRLNSTKREKMDTSFLTMPLESLDIIGEWMILIDLISYIPFWQLWYYKLLSPC